MGECFIVRRGSGIDPDELSANAVEVLSGQKFYGEGSDEIQTGTMPNRGRFDWAHVNSEATLHAGYYSGGTISSKPSYNQGHSDGYNAGYAAGQASRARTANGEYITKNPGEIYGFHCGFRPNHVYIYNHTRYSTYLYDSRHPHVMFGYANGNWHPMSDYKDVAFEITDTGFNAKLGYSYAGDKWTWHASE